MYLRHTTRKKDGKVHRYWSLVRSVRVGGRVIQQTVTHLGELDEHGRVEARSLARHLIGAPEQAQLFDDGGRDLAVPVRLKGIRIERSRRFGDVYLALALWRGMGLEAVCERLLAAGQERIALVVGFDGFPLGYEVFAGNTHDSKTLQTIVNTMEARHGVVGRVWIADRGMASAANLAWLRQTDRRYIIGAPKSELKKFGAELACPDGWRTVQDGVEVKLARHPETGETAILCRSADRRSKEKAMHDKFSGRIAAALERLAARIARSKKRLDAAPVNRQIGRILQQNQRAAARFAIALEPDPCPASFRLSVTCNDAFDDWAALSEGAYLLRSNIIDWSDQQLWKAYIQLTQAEAAFRIQKDQLNVRPIWHQREDRVQAHILVCFLAFVLWKCLEMWQSRAGLGNSPRTILEELARIQSSDVVLPTATHGQIRLRCITQPDPAQTALLDRLGIVLPRRMHRAEHELPALAPVA